MRIYDKKHEPNEDDDIYSVKEWIEEIKNICCRNDDGSGYWMKDGYINDNDEVFSSEPEDATHVIWYNK